MDTTEAIKLLNEELDILIHKAHKSGLNYWQILKIFLIKSMDLMRESEVEYHIKGGA